MLFQLTKAALNLISPVRLFPGSPSEKRKQEKDANPAEIRGIFKRYKKKTIFEKKNVFALVSASLLLCTFKPSAGSEGGSHGTQLVPLSITINGSRWHRFFRIAKSMTSVSLK